MHRELLLHHNRLVDRREELLFLGVVAHSVYQSLQLWRQLLDSLSDLLFLRLVVFVLLEVLRVLRLELLEDFALVCLVRVDLH